MTWDGLCLSREAHELWDSSWPLSLAHCVSHAPIPPPPISFPKGLAPAAKPMPPIFLACSGHTSHTHAHHIQIKIKFTATACHYCRSAFGWFCYSVFSRTLFEAWTRMSVMILSLSYFSKRSLLRNTTN
jgi:hypothetical protein